VSRPIGSVVLLVLALLLAGCSGSSSSGDSGDAPSTVKPRVVKPSTSSGSSRFQRYVAMGDSFSAGPLIPTTDLAAGCARSDHNYPSLLAERLGVRTFVDVTCSGARTTDLTHVQPTFGDARIPPQARALNDKTDLVTVGLGGNDLALFNTLVRVCTQVAGRDPTGSPCTRELATRGVDLDTVTRTISAHVAAALREVKRRAPTATVVLVGYLRLAPDSGSCSALPLATGDYAIGRRIGEALTRAQRRAARSTDVRFVDMYAASRGHDICSKDPWVNGRVTDRQRALSYHPFESGMKADAEQVLATLGKS
jgi:lysophospholipase L1-like esterase